MKEIYKETCNSYVLLKDKIKNIYKMKKVSERQKEVI